MQKQSVSLLIALMALWTSAPSLEAVTARTSSSEGESTRAELAVDGDFGTRWSSESYDPQWLEVDLEHVQDVTGVTLFWEAAFGKRYDVQVSEDGKSWITVYKVQGGDGSVDDIYFGKHRARYLRISGEQRGTAWGYSLWEVTVRGAEDEIFVVTSSDGTGDIASIFDGDTETAWRCDQKDSNPMILLKSEKGMFSAGIDIIWGPEPPESLTVETSDDGRKWTRVYENHQVKGGSLTCPVALAGARMLRLSVKPGRGGTWSLAELVLRSWNEQLAKDGLDTVHGIVGAEAYDWVTFVGKDGTFAPEPHAYQVSFWLSGDGAVYSPALEGTQWDLREGRLPIYETSWRAGAVDVNHVTFARYVDSLKRLVTFSRVRVENSSSKVRDVSLHMSIETNPLASKWNTKLHELANNGDGSVSVNGKPTLFLKAMPAEGGAAARMACSAMRHAPLEAGSPVAVNNTVRGGVVTYACVLAPGETREFDFFALSGEDRAVSAEAIRALDVDKQLAATEHYWRQRVPLCLDLPDRRYTDAFYASLYYILIMMKGNALFPGPYNYKSFFLHDAVEMNSALDNAGLHDVAERVTKHFDYREGGGYLDELGGSIYALYEHARMAGDGDFLKQVYPRMIRGCRLIQKLRRQQMGPDFEGTPYYGLMPRSASQDNFTLPAYLYVDNWWALLGLRATSLAARRLGHNEDEKWLQAEYKHLLEATLSSIRQVMKKEGLDVMPGFADYWPPEKRAIDAEHRILGDTQMAWAHRSPLFPGRTLGVKVPMDLFADSYRKYWDRSGRFSNYDGGWYVEYEKLFWGYNVQLAIPPMYLGMEDVTLKNIEWSLRHQACPGGWAEGYVTCDDDDGLRRVCAGPIIGDVPHGWTAAYYVLLLRNMLMREEEGTLLLLPCVPASWIAPGQRIAVKNAPTYYGRMSWSAECSTAGHLQVTLDVEQPPPKGYLISLPESLSVESAELDTGSQAQIKDNRVRVPPGSRSVTVRFKKTRIF